MVGDSAPTEFLPQRLKETFGRGRLQKEAWRKWTSNTTSNGSNATVTVQKTKRNNLFAGTNQAPKGQQVPGLRYLRLLFHVIFYIKGR